jgi:tRNA threonylcarbamoyladenosine biosynthesis protein TsaE
VIDPVRRFEVADEASQVALGGRIGAACGERALLFLRGDLGAGKTTLTRGLLRGFGHGGAVKSPTYTLIEPYDLGGRRVYHLDLYRVGDPGELEYLGLRELLAEPAVILIEWPERGGGWLPEPDLDIRIAYRRPGREVVLEAFSAVGRSILAQME